MEIPAAGLRHISARVLATSQPSQVALGRHVVPIDRFRETESDGVPGTSAAQLLLASIVVSVLDALMTKARTENLDLGQIEVRGAFEQAASNEDDHPHHAMAIELCFERSPAEERYEEFVQTASKCPMVHDLSQVYRIRFELVPIDPVQEAGKESFPASDPPSYNPGHS